MTDGRRSEVAPLTPRPPLIVADDLGSWPSKTNAILEAFEGGLIAAASITPNFPDFERACLQVHERSVTGRVGAHLVLTEGTPLTAGIRRSRRFCDVEGRFLGALRTKHLVWLASHERELVAAELRAQLGALRGQHLPISHVDSHHHVHNQLPIGSVVIALCREFGIGRVRLGRNLGAEIGLAHRAYTAVLNRRLRRAGLAGTRYFTAVRDYRRMTPDQRARGSFELHVHPITVADGSVADEGRPDIPLEEYLAGIR